MSLLDKLRKEAELLKEEEVRGNFSKVNWFKPEKGDNIIRVLPHWDKPGEELFFKRVEVHYGVPLTREGKVYKIPVRCLKDFGEDCPLCEKSDELFADGGEKAKEKAKEFRSSSRALYNIIDYKDRQAPLKTYAAPITVHKDIVYWMNEVGENIADPKSGRNWKLLKEVESGKPPQFGTSYKIHPDLKESSLPSKMMVHLENIPNLDEVYNENHREAMCEMLGIESGAVSKSSDDDDVPIFVDEPVVKAKAKAKPKSNGNGKVAKKATVVVEEAEEEEEDLGVETEDEELEAELKRLGV